MWSYLLPVVAALYAWLELRKDWRAHETPWRQGAAFALILVIAVGTAVNNYRSTRRIADAQFYIAGQGATMNVRTGVDGNSYIVSVGYPPIGPTNPLVVNL